MLHTLVVWVLGGLVLISSCTGQVPTDSTKPNLTDEELPSLGDMPEQALNDLNEALPANQCDRAIADVGTMPSRRLTTGEYDRTLRDLFPGIDVGQPSREHDFPTDVRHRSLFTNDARHQIILPRLAAGYMEVAQSLSAKATSDLDRLLGCPKLSDNEDACAKSFIEGFGKRAFRRPLSKGELDDLTAFYRAQKEAQQFKGAIQAVIERLLISPKFLYRFETLTPQRDGNGVSSIDPWSLASRLSYLITGSMPDAELLEAAGNGGLQTREDLMAHAERLLDTDDAHATMALFFEDFYQLFRITGISKPKYPSLTPAVVGAMKQEVAMLLDEIFFNNGDAWAKFVSGSHTYLNPELAAHYQLDAPTGDGFVRTELNPERRAGFLTLGGVMTMLAGTDDEHPEVVIYRGKWFADRLTCWDGPEVPLGVPPLEFSSAGLSNREILEKHVSEPACAACHQFMDPFGYAFENYDAVGRWRDEHNGHPVDASGEIKGLGTVDGMVNGPGELGRKLADSVNAKACFAKRLFENATGREMHAERDVCTVRRMAATLIQSGSLKQTLLSYVGSEALRLTRDE